MSALPARLLKLVTRIALAAGAALLFLLMLLPVAYFALRSPLLYNKVAPELASRLQPMGIELEQPGTLQIDLLRSVTLHDVRLRWHDKEIGDLDLAVGTLDLEYAFAPLLTGRLEINHLILKDVQVIAHILPQPEAPPPSSKPFTLAQLDTLLRSPPLPFRIHQLNLENIRFDVRTDADAQQWQQLSGHLQQASGDAVWQTDHLQGILKLLIDKETGGNWLVTQKALADTHKLEFTPTLNTRLHWDLSRNDQGWQLHKAELNHQLTLQQAELTRERGDTTNSLGKSDTLALNIRGSATSRPGQQPQQGLLTLFPLEIDTHLDSALGNFKLEGFRQDGLQLDLLADHQLTLTLQGQLQPFASQPPPLTFTGQQTLTLQHLDAALPGQQALVRNLNLTLDTSGDAPVSSQTAWPLKFDLNLDGNAGEVHVTQQPQTPGAIALQASFAPELQLQTSGNLTAFDDWQQALTLHFQPELTTRDLAIQLGEGRKAEHYTVDKQHFSALGDYRQGQLTLTTNLDLTGTTIPQITRRFSLGNQLNLTTDTELTQPEARLKVVLDKRPLADLTLEADNQAGTLKLHHELTATLLSRLRRLHPAAKALDKTGDLKLRWDGDLTLQHGTDTLLAADFSQLDQWPLEHKGQLKLRQTRPPRDSDGVTLTAPLQLTYSIDKANDYQTALHLKAPGIQMPPLVKPMPLQIWHKARFDWPLKQATTGGTVRIGNSDAVNFRLTAHNRPKRLALDSRWSLNAQPDWKTWLPALASLETVGELATSHWLKGEISHPNHSILDFDPEQLDRLRAKLMLDSHLTQSADHPGTLLRLTGPTDLKQTLDWSTRKAKLQGQFRIATAEASQQIRVEALTGNFQLEANSGLQPDAGKLAFQLTNGSLELLEQGADQTVATNLKQVVVPLDLSIAARQSGEKVILDDLQLHSGGQFMTLQASGEATLDGRNAQLEGTLVTNLRPDLLINPYLSGAGSAHIPWRLVLLEGSQVSLDGEIRFDNLDIATKAFQLRGLDGGLKIEEELIWTGEALQYRYLEDTDPFQRVDFTRIQPFLENRHDLRIAQISAADKTLGPALASLNFKQNVLHLQQLDLDLFGGHLTGQVYLDTRPGAWTIGLLSRITQLDPRKLLPRGSKSREQAYAPLNVRTAVEFDIQRRLLQGRIDITRITREQLFQLLEIIDPDYQDEQLAQLRSALRIAHPQRLGIEMRQGLLDLEVIVSALAKPLRLRGLPLTPLIQHFGGVALEQLGKIPLE
jgi:hypothetical protein